MPGISNASQAVKGSFRPYRLRLWRDNRKLCKVIKCRCSPHNNSYPNSPAFLHTPWTDRSFAKILKRAARSRLFPCRLNFLCKPQYYFDPPAPRGSHVKPSGKAPMPLRACAFMPDGPGCADSSLDRRPREKNALEGALRGARLRLAREAWSFRRCAMKGSHGGRLAHFAPRQQLIRRCFLAGAVPPRDKPALGIP